MLTSATILATLVAADPHVVYVNFDGVELQECANDSPRDNCIDDDYVWEWLPPPPIQIMPFNVTPLRRAEIVRNMRDQLGEFNVRFTDERPGDSTDYDMVVIGYSDPPPGFPSGGGQAPTPDCRDQNGGNTGVMWWDDEAMPVNDVFPVKGVPYGWGLESVGAEDLMSTDESSTPATDVCHPIVVDAADGMGVEPGPAVCPEQHLEHCTEPDHQNSYRELLAILGPYEPDDVPPTVTITTPANGESVDPTFDLDIELSDNQSPQFIRVVITLDGTATDFGDHVDPVVTFPVEELPDGEHTIVVEARDEDGNSASDEVTFTVGEMPDTGTDDGETDGSDTETTDPDGGDATDDSSEKGCSCRAAPTNAAPLLLLPLLYRRRRA